MTIISQLDSSRTLHGVGIAPGVGEGLVLHHRRMDRSGFAEARGRVVVCSALGDSEAVLLAQARPAAVIITGAVSHSVAAVLRDARIPTVGGVSLGASDLSRGSGAIVDGVRGRVWRNALLVSADGSRK